MIENLILCNQKIELKDAYMAGFNELTKKSDKLAWIYLGDDADVDTPNKNFETYVNRLLKRETEPPPGFVCDTIWWAITGNEMVGRISFRHELNEFLKKVGGHIGYIVHPKWRNKGIATWMLSEVLKTERVKQTAKVLLTCDDSNGASEKTIVRNGGVFDKLVDLGSSRTRKKHFWIET